MRVVLAPSRPPQADGYRYLCGGGYGYIAKRY